MNIRDIILAGDYSSLKSFNKCDFEDIFAIQNGNLVIKFLKEADVGTIKNFMRTCYHNDIILFNKSLVHYVLAMCQHDIVKLLITDFFIDLNVGYGVFGDWPIHILCRRNELSLVEFIINHDSKVNVSNLKGINPIYIACENNNVSLVKFLVENGSTVDHIVKMGEIPNILHLACENKNEELFCYLLEHGANFEIQNNKKWKPIHLACMYFSLSTIKKLIDLGAGYECETLDKWRPIHFVCRYRAKESDIVNYFFKELCIDCETQTKDLWKPVNLLCKYSTHEILIPLLQKFQDFDTIDKYQKSPFLYFFDENVSISVLGTNKKYQNGKLIKAIIDKQICPDQIFVDNVPLKDHNIQVFEYLVNVYCVHMNTKNARI